MQAPAAAPKGTVARLREWLPRGGVLTDADWAGRHRTITWLLVVQSIALFVFGVVRGESPIHVGWEVMIPLICAVLAQADFSRDVRAVIATFGLVAISGIFVHLSGGTIEAHFHFFIMLAVISLYQEWRAFGMAIAFVALHHGIVGVLDPTSVYNHMSAQRDPWTWAGIHAALVLGESLSLIVLWRFSEQAHDRAVNSKNELLEEQQRHLEQLGIAEAAMRAQEARLKEAQSIAHIGSWDWDLATNEVVGSDELYRIFGLESHNVVSTFDALIGMIHPDDRPKVDAEIEQALETRRPYSVEFRVIRPDGKVIKTVGSGKAIVDSTGNPVRLVGIIQDVTEQKSLEDQLLHAQKMEAIGHLAGGVAHDFNNLLAVVINYGHMLSEDIKDPTKRADVDEIIKAADQGARLTRQLLNFSRKEFGNKVTIDLAAVVSDLTVLIERTLGEKCNLALEIADDLWNVDMDRAQFEQVLMNLAVNARDAMPVGGDLTIRVSNCESCEEVARRGAPDNGWIHIEVVDTGIGMDADTLEHVFEPFFTTKPRERGSGLGLATVYGIVERVGGRITVESKVGTGTRFDIYLPRAMGDLSVIPEDSTGRTAEGSEKVLVVEDRASVAAVTRRVLERAGYAVAIANNGAEGLREAEGDPGIDLVLTDVVMPELSGPEMVAELRKVRPDLPVVFMSGYMDKAVDAAPEDHEFLQKPFEPSDLLNTIRKVLDAPHEEPSAALS